MLNVRNRMFTQRIPVDDELLSKPTVYCTDLGPIVKSGRSRAPPLKPSEALCIWAELVASQQTNY